MSTIERFSSETHLKIPVSYFFKSAGENRDLVVLLHGFQDTAAAFLKRALEERDYPFSILAPNAPFPMPIEKEDGFQEAYSWYFAHYSKKLLLIPPEVSVSYLHELVTKLGLASHRKVVVGFSQGGYFAPFASRRLTNVGKIIGVGCGYRPDDYKGLEVDAVDAIHGDHDPIISIESSKKMYEELRPAIKRGDFLTVPGLKHAMNDQARKLLLSRIQLAFDQERLAAS